MALLAGRIQHTLISNCVTRAAWEQHVEACLRYGFQAAMVPAAWVKATVEALRGSGVRTASWIDLPFGSATSAGKAYEARQLVDAGAEEIDLMPNVGFLVSGMEREYFDDIRGVVAAAPGRPVKVIMEMPLLSADQLSRAVALAADAGAAYVKNLSGGAAGAATPEQVQRLRELTPVHLQVKASGGIRTARQVQDLLAAGAALVGTSRGVEIVKELQEASETTHEATPRHLGVPGAY
ncbi:MAG TPA: deoxyribose-phosphate aldolase [Terriglobia bacterium]